MRAFCGGALLFAVMALAVLLPARVKSGADAGTNLLSWGAGALVVVTPASYVDSGNWSADSLLDELSSTGWATPAGLFPVLQGTWI